MASRPPFGSATLSERSSAGSKIAVLGLRRRTRPPRSAMKTVPSSANAMSVGICRSPARRASVSGTPSRVVICVGGDELVNPPPATLTCSGDERSLSTSPDVSCTTAVISNV